MDKEIVYQEAIKFFNSKEYEKAIELYSDVIIHDINNKRALFNRAASYCKIGKFDEAISDFKKVIELEPENAYAYDGRGYCYFKKNNFEKAIIDYNKSIELKPTYANAFNNRGHLKKENGQMKEAMDDFNKAIELDPKFAMAYINRGASLVRLKEFERAIEDYDKSIDLDPNNAMAYCNRGIAYFHLENFLNAKKDFEKSILLNPNMALNYEHRGKILCMEEKFDEALLDFENEIKLNPNNIDSYTNIAAIYFMKNEFHKAYIYSVIQEEISNNEDSDTLFNSKSKINTIKNDNLIYFFSHFDAPFLFNRIIKQQFTLENQLLYNEVIKNNFDECSDVKFIINYFESSDLIDKKKFEILKGIITYYMRDPSVCYKIFTENVISNSPNDLIGHYYSILSCDDYLKSEPEKIQENAVKSAMEYLNAENRIINNLQSYYAGQIFFIAQNFQKALDCFSENSDFIPSICMMTLCYDELERSKERDLYLDNLIFLDKQNNGLLQYLNIPKLSIDDFEETVMEYAHCREIEGVITLLNDYKSKKTFLFRSINKATIPDANEIFKIDKESIEGKASLEKIRLWKQEVIDGFCNEKEHLFKLKIMDHFQLWERESNKDKLEFSLGSDIPFLFLKRNLKFEIIDLIDYFNVKGMLNDDARYLLVFWAELCKYRNQKLSEIQKMAIKTSTNYLFKITLGYFGYPLLLIPSVVFFIGEQFAKANFTEMIIDFIEDSFIRSDNSIPEFYTDFKKQFAEYIKEI